MLSVILVDDESLARQGLRDLLADFPDVAVVGEAACVDDAVKLIRETGPDAIFLDVRMPGPNGFALFEKLPGLPCVVFVTAYAEHAARAFEVHAVDYLLKPVTPARLGDALGRIRESIGGDAARNEEHPVYEKRDRICLQTPGRTLIAEVDSIGVLRAEGDFTKVHVAGERPILICRSLRYFESILPPETFLRLDRSVIVNLGRVLSADQKSRDEIVIHLAGIDESVGLGRTAWSRLKASSAFSPGP